MVRKYYSMLGESVTLELENLKMIKHNESLRDQKGKNLAGMNRKYSMLLSTYTFYFFIRQKAK